METLNRIIESPRAWIAFAALFVVLVIFVLRNPPDNRGG